MSALGTLGVGIKSVATGVNGNRTVVVGQSDLSGGVQRAFRWTQAGGMVSVDDWLRGQGATLANNVTYYASGVSADGNIVVGTLQNNHAFIARGATTVITLDTTPTDPSSRSPSGPQPVAAGLMDVQNYQQSLVGMGRFDATVASTDMTINGANSSPLFSLLDAGRSDVWTSAASTQVPGAALRLSAKSASPIHPCRV